jgi:hypothetical protein
MMSFLNYLTMHYRVLRLAAAFIKEELVMLYLDLNL